MSKFKVGMIVKRSFDIENQPIRITKVCRHNNQDVVEWETLDKSEQFWDELTDIVELTDDEKIKLL